MYTWEIEELLLLKNYLLTGKEYLEMIKTSPQIKQIRYNGFEDSFEIWTTETDNSSKYFKYKVKRQTNRKKD